MLILQVCEIFYFLFIRFVSVMIMFVVKVSNIIEDNQLDVRNVDLILKRQKILACLVSECVEQ